MLDVRDTDAGRVVIYRMAAVRGSAQDWMTIAPATAAQAEQGVRSALASVDVPDWAEPTAAYDHVAKCFSVNLDWAWQCGNCRP